MKFFNFINIIISYSFQFHPFWEIINRRLHVKNWLYIQIKRICIRIQALHCKEKVQIEKYSHSYRPIIIIFSPMLMSNATLFNAERFVKINHMQKSKIWMQKQNSGSLEYELNSIFNQHLRIRWTLGHKLLFRLVSPFTYFFCVQLHDDADSHETALQLRVWIKKIKVKSWLRYKRATTSLNGHVFVPCHVSSLSVNVLLTKMQLIIPRQQQPTNNRELCWMFTLTCQWKIPLFVSLPTINDDVNNCNSFIILLHTNHKNCKKLKQNTQKNLFMTLQKLKTNSLPEH